ncbi:MAG: molybdate ABC transporter permease subunit [Planctomycetota bacterium]|nr:MAG: molybdate ABC transporter permease subunit [Planctomycetota bacterium]
MPSAAEWQVLALAARIAAAAVLLSFLPALLLAWVLARRSFRGKALLQGFIMLPLVMPPVVTGYLLLTFLGRSSFIGRSWFALTGHHLAYSTTACVLAAAVVGFPLLVEAIRLSLLGVDPRLESVSRSLGRGPTFTFIRITLPLALPGLLGGAVLSFTRALGEFGATMIFAGNIEGETRQIPLAVYTLLNLPGSETAVMRLTLLSIALSLSALLFMAWLTARHRQRSGRS